MKRSILCCLLAVFVVGCSDGDVMSTAPAVDPGEAFDGESGDLFGAQPGDGVGGIPIEDDAGPAVGGMKETTKETTNDVIKPVEINKRSGNLGACVIDESCTKKIGAKGGSREYAWTLIEGRLPAGLELADTETKKVKIQKAEGQEIDEVGEFTFKLKVEDQADTTRAAERQFKLTIKENLAIVLYTKDEGGNPVWRAVEETDADGNALQITVPPHGLLLVEVIGHAETYKWSIGGTEIVCNNQSCEGTREGLTLYKDTSLAPPEPPPPHFAYMILKAEEEFIGRTAQNVVIAAKDDFGSAASKTISSITFQQDPCKLPINVMTGQTTLNKSRGENYSFEFTVSGGQPPYSWFNTDTNGNNSSSSSTINGTTFTFTGTVSLDRAIDTEIERNVVVKDSCPDDDPEHPGKVTVTVNVGCRLAAVDHVEFNALFDGGKSDVDVCDETKTAFSLNLEDGTKIGGSGRYHIDRNDNDKIDDLSPTFSLSLDDTYCLEDITQFKWWLDGDACWEYPEAFVKRVLVVAEVGENEYLYAAWDGMIGEKDLGDAKTWTRHFETRCGNNELWCDDNPWEDYKKWRE